MTQSAKQVRVDLHGMGRWEAIEVVEAVLSRRSAREVEVIPGRGLHSPGRKPVIKPMVDAYLQRNGYWTHWHSKGGACTVTLDPEPLDW